MRVLLDGEHLPLTGDHGSARWTTWGGAQVLRVRLGAYDEGVPGVDDSGYGVVLTFDLVPHWVLDQTGRPIPIDQRIEAAFPRESGSYVDDKSMRVTHGAREPWGIRRVLVERECFCSALDGVDYQATGTLAIQHLGDKRIRGDVELRVAGMLAFFEEPVELEISGCFDVIAEGAEGCLPGEACGADCLDPSEWPCNACGTLYVTDTCGCLPDHDPFEECADLGDAAEGEACGEHWWCQRACAPGLRCADPSELDDSDAGFVQHCSPGVCVPR